MVRSLWNAPSPASTADQFSAKVDRQASGAVYEVELPDGVFALTPEVLRSGIQFNLVVNDNDGKGRKGFLRLAPGLGESKNPATWLRLQTAEPGH